MALPAPHPLPQASADTGLLPLSDGHAMHWRAQGPADGLPVLLLHGGPGSASAPRLCDVVAQAGPCRVVSFDQRGCGQSLPRGATTHNTLAHLVADIEALRAALGIARWLVVGGSWGATLATAYAARHPQAVSGLLLRGLFVPSQAELRWFFQGAASLHPVAWQAWAGLAPAHQRHDLLPWLTSVFSEGTTAMQHAVARAWLAWEQVLGGSPDAPTVNAADLALACDRYRVQTHYLQHQCWLGDAGVDQACAQLAATPLLLLHGEHDQVCRPGAAQAAWQASRTGLWRGVAEAGHHPFHPAMMEAMNSALRQFARQQQFAGCGDPP